MAATAARLSLRRRWFAAALLTLLGALLLAPLSSLPRLHYEQVLRLRDTEPYSVAQLPEVYSRGFSDATLNAARARDSRITWSADELRKHLWATHDDTALTTLHCRSSTRQCRVALEAVSAEWMARNNLSARLDVIDPAKAETPRNLVYATLLLTGALSLALAGVVGAGLIQRNRRGAWRVVLVTALTTTAMREGAFDGLLSARGWQLVQLVLLAGLIFLALPGLYTARARRFLWRSSGSGFGLGAGLLVTVAASSALVSPTKSWSLIQAVLLAVVLGTVLVSAADRWRTSARLRGDLDVVVISVSALLAWGLVVEFCGGTDWPLNPTAGRFQSFYFNPNIAGLLAAMCGLLALAGVWQRPRRWWLLAAGGVCAVVVLLSGSRGALVATAVGLIALGWVLGRWRALIVTTAAAMLGCSAVVLWARGREGGLLRLGGIFADAGRFDLWAQAWRRFLDHPLLGNGFRSGTDQGTSFTLHNVYLSLLAELGLAGVVAIAVLSATVIWGIIRTRRPWLVGAVVALVVAELFDSSLVGSLGAVALPGWLLLAGAAWAPFPARRTKLTSAPTAVPVERSTSC